MSRGDSRSSIERSAGAHMLRRGSFNGSESLIGLGVFKARGQIGDGLCQRPSCGNVAELFAAWLRHGHLCLIGLCPSCTRDFVILDERGEAKEESERRKKRKRALRRAARRREKALEAASKVAATGDATIAKCPPSSPDGC